jgi:hypothetical protein
MTLTELLLFLHIMSAIVFVGGLVARWVVRLQLHSARDIRSFVAASESAARVENLMVIPGNLAVLVLGVVLAVRLDAPIFGAIQGASENWLLVSNLLLALGLIAVPLYFLPRGRRFAVALEDAVRVGEVTPALHAEANATDMRVAHLLELAGVIVIVGLMVARPF